MMPFGRGRGFRWMYYATGLPRWARYSSGTYYWRCWRFPWLPRGWWTGIYGPIEWTPSGPKLVTQEESREALEARAKELEQEIAALQKELEEIKKKLQEVASDE